MILLSGKRVNAEEYSEFKKRMSQIGFIVKIGIYGIKVRRPGNAKQKSCRL
jgi:hypothetical protein